LIQNFVSIEYLVHLLDQIVDVLLSVAKVTALDKVVGDLPPATSWAGKLDRVQVVVSGLEVLADGVDLVHQVLDAVDAEVAHALLNAIVVGDLDSLTVDLDGASLVDHVLDGLLGWVAPGDEWITDAEHLDGGLVQADEDGVADLSESEKLEGLLGLWRELVDTSDSDDEGELGLVWHVEVSVLLGNSGVVDESVSLGLVLSSVSSSFADDILLLLEGGLLGDGLGLLSLGGLLGESGSLLGEALGHSGLADLGNGHFWGVLNVLSPVFCKFDLRL